MRTDLGPGEKLAAKGVAGLVGVLGVVGFGVSANHVAAAVEPSFGRAAWTVPFGVDVGIAAFTGLDLLMARMDVRSRWLRLVPWALIAVTVYLNVAGEPTMLGRVAHAVLPLTWVIAVEAGAHVLRTWAGLHTASERMDRVRASRWLLAPLPTLLLWRRMVLWEVRSYQVALDRTWDRRLARCDLQDSYGWFLWRWKAPRRQRAMYKRGDLTPAPLPPPAAEVPAVEPPTPPAPEVPTNGDVSALAERVAKEMAEQGHRVTRRALQARVKAAHPLGKGIGSEKATEIASRYP